MKKIVNLIVFMFFVIEVSAQIQITGKIVDADTHETLIGASVFEKGSVSNGTTSDIDGNFTLIPEKESGIIVVSYIGYLPQEFEFSGSTNFNIVMKTDVAGLDEVVVVGYGAQKKSHLTGSISKISNDGLEQIPVSRAEDALVGKVSGVTIQTSDATAGAAPTIRVRGIGSITADASPLIVVDGVVVDNDYLGSLDMNDVSSVEILKDAASAAIFGSRGGNGVIMFTTKDGKEGKTKFSFSTYYGTKFTADYDIWPSISEWTEMVKEANEGELTDRATYINQLGTKTDWLDVMFDGGTIQSYSLSARGGNDRSKFSISGSYLKDEGVLLTDEYEKFNFRLKLNTKVSEKVSFGGSVNPSYAKKRDFPIGIHDAIRQSPWLPIYHDENTIQYVDRSKYPDVKIGDYAKERHFDNYDLHSDGGNTDISTTSNTNPYAKVTERDYRTKDFKLLSNVYMNLELMNDLKFKSTLAVTYRHRQDEDWVGSKAHRNGTSAMESNYDTDTYIYWMSENIVTYDKSIDKHDISAVAGTIWEKWTATNSDQEGSGYEFDYIKTLNAASAILNSTTNKSKETMHSMLGRVNYAYDNKYLASLSLRYDGSSRFGKDTKYGFFPAGSLGWRITEEDFMKNIDWLSNLKARASYGVTGNNQGIGRYDAISRLEATTAVFNGAAVTGFNPLNIANPDLSWEKSNEISLGIDVGIFQNKWSFSADYYDRRSEDLLLDQEIPSVIGFTQATVNIGEVKNSGVELELSGHLINTNHWSWKIFLNASHNKNELVDFAGADGLISYVDAKRPAEYIALEGYPISSFYGYVYEKDIPTEYLKNALWPIGAESQDVYVKDMNGDGEIDEDDRTILGSPYPEWVWGFTSNINYKSFDLSFTFQGSHGAKVRNMDPQYFYNQFTSHQDYINTFPDTNKVKERIYTDLFVQDASYIALRSINLGWNLPKSVLTKTGFNNVRLYVAGSNLLYFTDNDYTSFNPEGTKGGDGNPLHAGYQRGAAPISKALTFGVNVEF